MEEEAAFPWLFQITANNKEIYFLALTPSPVVHNSKWLGLDTLNLQSLLGIQQNLVPGRSAESKNLNRTVSACNLHTFILPYTTHVCVTYFT